LTEYTKTPFIAANLLKSWLRAVGVDSQFLSREEAVLAVGDHHFIPSHDLLSRNKAVALAAFWEVTDRLGLERTQPFNRGVEPVNEAGEMGKASYKNDVFVAAIRPADFRRSVNPTQDQWKQYERIMKNACAKFLFQNKGLCVSHGLEIDDILQFGRCYIINFCNKYEVPLAEANENEKLFSVYVNQRLYGDLRRVLKKAQPGDDLEHTWLNFDESLDDSSHLFKMDTLTREQELENAQEHLNDRLRSLGHDQLVTCLRQALDNQEPGVAGAASRMLRKHLKNCSGCRLEEHKKLAKTDSLSA